MLDELLTPHSRCSPVHWLWTSDCSRGTEMDDFDGFTNQRESYGAYIARTTFVDPDKEAEEHRLRLEAQLQRQAKGAFKDHVRAMTERSTASASAAAASKSAVRNGKHRSQSASFVPATSETPMPLFVEAQLEKRMAEGYSRRRALTPHSTAPMLPSFAAASGGGEVAWESKAAARGLLDPVVLPAAAAATTATATTTTATVMHGPVPQSVSLRASLAAQSATGRRIVAAATHQSRLPERGRQTGALAPTAREALAGIPQRRAPLPAGSSLSVVAAAGAGVARSSFPDSAESRARSATSRLGALPPLPQAARLGLAPRSVLPPGSSQRAREARGRPPSSYATGRGSAAHLGAGARGGRGPRAASQSAEPLPRLVGDSALPDSPLDDLRRARWRELRFLHSLMVRHGRTLDELSELFGTRDHLRRSHFTVIMTGFLGLNGWEMDPHFKALFDGFDLSNRAAIDPREIICSLNLLDKPTDEVASAVCYGFGFFAFKPRGSAEGLITRERMLALMFAVCATQVEEDGLRAKLFEVVAAFERFVGDPLPERVAASQLRQAIFYAPKFQDEFRRLWMQRLPDGVRMKIMRRGAERASLRVQAHERALNVHKATVFVRDKIRPQVIRQFFAEWAQYTQDAVRIRELEDKADKHFFVSKTVTAIRRWRRHAALPAKWRWAKRVGKGQLVSRCFARWKKRWLPFSVLKKRSIRLEQEELERTYAMAMEWRRRREERQSRDLLQAGWWAIMQEFRRRLRYRRAQDFRIRRLQLNQFRTWAVNSVEAAKTRRAAEARKQEIEAAARARVERLLREQQEAEKRAIAEAEAKVRSDRIYKELMLQQRRRAAMSAAFSEATKSMAMRRTFRRRKAFNKLTRRGLKLWDAEKPAKLEARRQQLWTWLHETDEGRSEIGDIVTYIRLCTEQPGVPAHIRGTTAGGAAAAAAEDLGGDDDTPRDDAPRKAMVEKSAVIGPDGMAIHVRGDTVGTREREPWQLNYNYKDLVRQWVNIKTGESVGPKSNKAGLPKMTDALARRIATENFLAIREPYLEQVIDADYPAFADAAARHGYAYIIQDFVRTYFRVMKWKEVKDQALAAKKRETAIMRARIRKASIVTIQCSWRCFKARQDLRWRLLGNWSVYVDTSTMSAYFTSAATGESRWECPDLLAHMCKWNWHHDRSRRLAMMSEEQQDEYWANPDIGGAAERDATALLAKYSDQLFDRRLRRALGVMQGTAEGDDAELLSDVEDPMSVLTIKPRAGAPPVRQILFEAEQGIAGHFFRCETGEITTMHPDGYILCERCTHKFAQAYVEDEDAVLCLDCFVEAHAKGSRAETPAYVIAPGPYVNPFQAPQHCNRTPQQLFGESFAQPVINIEYRRAHPQTKAFLLYDTEA